MTGSLHLIDIGRQASLLLVERSGIYFNLEWMEKFRLINVGEWHNENPMHVALQNSVVYIKRIIYFFLFLKVCFWDRVGKVQGIFINLSEMKLQSIAPGEMIFCHHYFTGKFYIIKALSFWWYMILIKHHDDHDDVYVSHDISSEWYLWNDLSG